MKTGIVVVGKDHQGHGYVLGDASGKHQPAEWAKIAVAAYRTHHADRIVAERNNGGAMVEATITAASVRPGARSTPTVRA